MVPNSVFIGLSVFGSRNQAKDHGCPNCRAEPFKVPAAAARPRKVTSVFILFTMVVLFMHTPIPSKIPY